MVLKKLSQFISFTVLSSSLSLLGCASVPPPHENSFYIKDEKVTMKMLSCDSLQKYKKDWDEAFKLVHVLYPCPTKVEPTKLAPVIGIAVGIAGGIAGPLAFDYVKKKLNEESENYVQQFGTTYFSDDFWQAKEGKYTQKYYGFEISRSARFYNAEAEKDDSQQPVFRLIYGIAEDEDGLFWAAPLYITTNKTKAKVAMWSGKHKIDSKIEIGLDSAWKDEKGKFHKENIAKFDPLMIKDFDIDTPLPLRTSCDEGSDKTCHKLSSSLNAFGGVPISNGTSAYETGKFWFTVLVTESDTAKTKKYITDLSDILDKNRDKVIDAIKKKVP